MPSLGERQKKLLLQIARKAMIAAVQGERPPEIVCEDDLLQPGGAFVTLHRGPHLRGCIGQLPGDQPLANVVAHCAGMAALEDPRFRPVTREELANIHIEISVLSIPEDIAPQDIVIGTHGLLVSRASERGVLLPQVATRFGWSSMRFLEETCVKAGIERQAWKDPNTRIQVFTAEIFSEADFRTSEALKESYSIST
ncbi:MAG: AmmeMemoRadiSam system protein A [Candidatus Acidiferrales bacterium]